MPAGSNVVYDHNPVFVPLGIDSYGQVFENCLRVLLDYGFEIQESNRYYGTIECLPRVSPGLGLFLKPGSPDLRDRLLATTQSYRHRISVEGEFGRLAIEIENVPSENPRTGKLSYLSTIALLKDLSAPLRVGT